jgi:hemolysin III
MAAPARITWGPMQNPVRGTLHGGAALACLALAAGVVGQPPDVAGPARLVLALLATSHAGLFAVSALYHSVPWTTRWKRRMQRVDHSMIYVKIAGTLTAFAWLAMDGAAEAAIIGAAWGIALAGAAQKLLYPGLPERASIPVQLLQAGLGIPVLAALAEQVGGAPPSLLAGPLFYGAGAVVFLTERPRLWPRIFSFHELFHVLVVAGSAATTWVVLRALADA